MSPRRTLRLVHADAYGNDFLMVESGRLDPSMDLPGLARRVCDRRQAAGGADGLIVVTPTAEGADTRLLNADGSPSEVSGNGTRCVGAWLAVERGLQRGASLIIGTGAGPRPLTLLEHAGGRYTFRAGMGTPAELREERLTVAGQTVTAVVMRVGNPQCVVLGPVTEERLRSIGAGLAVHPFFPEGTNVELALVERPDRVRILIWERGVGPTAASGTGACAAAVAAAAYGGADRAVDVVAPGGSQRVEWTPDQIWLTGWAEVLGMEDRPLD
jgi:diaminopimelate epimerase